MCIIIIIPFYSSLMIVVNFLMMMITKRKRGIETDQKQISREMSQSSDSSLSESIPDKVVLVGDVGVGKTSLFVRFETGQFKESTSHDPRKGEVRKEWNVGNSTVAVSVRTLACSRPHRMKS